MNPFISLCMIVKDESKVLKRCLESVAGIIDEIIVVDTGSTDNTKAIAQNFTDKVYDYQWNNNFSEARNYAASKATGEWILVLDADEYLERSNIIESIETFKSLNPHFDIYAVNITNFVGDQGGNTIQNKHVRFYKNNQKIEYHRSIHEQLRYKDNSSFIIGELPSLMIYHSGYLAKTVQEKNKTERNLSLVDSELMINNNKGFDYYNLGNELKAAGKIEEALSAYINAYRGKESYTIDWVSRCIVSLIECLITLKRYTDALNVIRDVADIYPTSPDFIYLKGLVLLQQKNYLEAKDTFLFLLSNEHMYTRVIKTNDYKYYLPYIRLGNLFELDGDFETSIKHYVSAINYNSRCLESISRIIHILSRNFATTEMFEFIKKRGWLKNQELLTIIIKIIQSNRNFELAKKLAKSLTHEDDIYMFSITCNLFNGKYDQIINEIMNKSLLEIKNMIQNNWIDFYELIIIGLISKQPKKLLYILKDLISGDSEKRFLCLLLEDIKENDILNEPIYLVNLMEKTIQLNHFELFEKLTTLKKYYDNSINLLIGHMLYKYNFEDIAISFYLELESLEKLDDEAFVNIISKFIKNDDINNALEYSLTAINQGRADFRIFKYGIDLAEQEMLFDLQEGILKLALEHYPESKFIKSKFDNLDKK